MTKEPELGSGALREALDKVVEEYFGEDWRPDLTDDLLRAALSLSSPRAEASSEIREALADVIQFFDSNYESSEEWCSGPSAKYFDGLLTKLRALAPSRQGAGGK